MTRTDQPEKVMEHKDRYAGGTALVVLGGPSGKGWKALSRKIKPDVIMGANGACFEVDDLDYHMVVENMNVANRRALRGEEKSKRIMEILANRAKIRLISCLSWELVEDKSNAISIRRMGARDCGTYEEQFKRFSFRKYGSGYLQGPLFDLKAALRRPDIKLRIGTVAVSLIHHAGILGVKEVHTIGMDFRETGHWYRYPQYEVDGFRSADMFTTYKCIPTQWEWIQAGRWLKTMQPLFERDGLEWHDHSDGLLQAMGLWCAKF